MGKLQQILAHWITRRRLRFGRMDTLPQLALLSIPVGLLSGGVIIAFRLWIEGSQSAFLPAGDPEGYEALSPAVRAALAIGSGLLLGIILHFLRPELRASGIAFVLERLTLHQGHVPTKSALVHFVLSGLSIIGGQSVGREGPSVHLGAAAASSTSRRLGLPNNSARTLLGCGAAAAIAASFDTPLAGVIFAMEVILMEYTIAGFAPVILAAVCASALTRWVFGAQLAFTIPDAMIPIGLSDLPLALALGVATGILAALFIYTLRETMRISKNWPLWFKPTLAGMIVALISLQFPQVMSIGYDTVNGALLGSIAWQVLAGLVIAKLLASVLCVGLAVPGGLIGPTLVIGAAAGGALASGLQGSGMVDGFEAPFFVLLGMAAMMGATLQAPLAALTALLELTGETAIILPGMVTIITAHLIAGEFFRQKPVFRMQLRARGIDLRDDPLSQALQRASVARRMDRDLIQLPQIVDRQRAEEALKNQPHWILVRDPAEGQTKFSTMMPAADLARTLAMETDHSDGDDAEPPKLDLTEIPAERLQLTPIHYRATLAEALEQLNAENADAVYVMATTAPGIQRVRGVVTRKQILRGYGVG